MRQKNVPLTLSSTAMTGTATLTSTGIDLISAYAFSIQVTWSGGSATVGTFKLQASNDPGDNGSGQGVSQPTHWTDVTSSSQAISGTPGSIMYDVTECAYRWVRLSYTNTSGTGTIQTAVLNSKGV